MKAILSIRPEFVEKIISGEKKYEFRKKVFKQEIEAVIIYSTKPVGCFIGEFKLKRILSGNIEKIWLKTRLSAGISQEFFHNYFKNAETAYALHIDDLIIYDNPINPVDVIPDFKPPQSFCYVSVNVF